MTYAIPRFASVQVDGDLILPDRDGYVRMLPWHWRKLKAELHNLDFDAQEYVCQLCVVYLKEHSFEEATAHKRTRKFLARTGGKLTRLIKWLDRRPDLEELANALRLAHRPLGDPLTPLDRAGLSSSDLYFIRKGLPDPSTPILTFMQCMRDLSFAMKEERKFLRGQPSRTRALWKTRPNLRKGRMEYLLLRIFRERSNPRATLEIAHRRMASVFRKLLDRRLKFDPEKKYYPAIHSAIDRLKPEEKTECDQRLLRDLNMRQPTSKK